LAIAELAGADWAGKARKAATAIERVCDTADIDIELLADTKSIFESVEEVATKTFIAKLCEDEERPWATFSKGKTVTDRQLARMLRKYNITSEDVYPSGVHAKGYKRVRFEDVWARYLVEPKNTS